jgi:predicted alpha/beta hydrolase
MAAARVTAVTDDGVRLVLRRYRPAGRARATCLATHAMMASGSYMERRGFADHLAARGVELFVLDFRGHGESVPPWPRGGRGWSFDDYVERDLPAALAAVAAAAGREPGELGYLGHSLGGLVGLAAFGTSAAPAPARLALWATSVWLPGQRRGEVAGSGGLAAGLRRRGQALRRRALIEIYAASARPLGHAPIRRLGLGTDDEPRRYVEDLRRWVRSGRFTSRAGTDYAAAAACIGAPTWAVVGEGDRLCTPSDAEAVLGWVGSEVRSLRRVGRARGDAVDPDHFALFTRPELAPLWDEAARFLTER